MTQQTTQNQKIPNLGCTVVCSAEKFQNEKPNLEHEFAMYSRTYKRNSKIPIFFSNRRGVERKKQGEQGLFIKCKTKTTFSTEGGYHLKIYWNFGIFIYIYILYYYYYYYLYGSQGDLPRLKKFQNHFFILEFYWNFLAILEFFCSTPLNTANPSQVSLNTTRPVP